ncbi:bacterial Ig-like domain-containing protein [uncultured Propionibacterium sp.]|uniref:bacterial Ig-like domain-containing protein n=1 Tax=uncultured Propionibacterium sp. TaxID=218066 RepID=UPI00292DEE13|nr:bacterial Ig-like domain-containing protein [uncultured Propionibacterium sp.]
MNSTGRQPATVNRSGAVRIGAVIVMMLFCLLGLGAPVAAASSPGAVYTGPTTTDALLDNGLSHSTYFTATNGAGALEESNHSTAAGSPQALSIIDIDGYSDLNAVIELSNASASAIDLDEVVALPSSYSPAGAGAPQLRVDASRVRTDENGLSPSPGAAGVEVAYGSTTDAYSPYAEWSAANDWSALQTLRLTGSLGPGEKFRLTIPLVLANESELDLNGAAWVGIDESIRSPASAGAATRIRFARRVTDAEDGASPFASTAQYRASSNAPQSIQSVMPTMAASDLTVSNIALDGTTDSHTAGPGDSLFTGGTVSLDLARVKSAVRDTGWQVDAAEGTSDGLAGSYLYSGDALYSAGATSSGALNGAPVRLRQVISAVSSTIPLGAAWSPADNLNWIHDHTGADVDPGGPDVRVVSNVDTGTPGVYRVTYYYAPQAYYGPDGYEAAVTTEVTVAGTHGSPSITGTTTLQGGELRAGQFAFEMTEASGSPIATTTNLADGSFAFDPPAARSGIGTAAEYTITEEVPADAGKTGDGAPAKDGIIYDTHTERVQVRVIADESGSRPVAMIVTDSDGVLFSNTVDGTGTPSPSPTPPISPNASAPTPGAPDSPAEEDGSAGSIPLISAESSTLAMGTGAVMVAVGTAMGLHSNRH